MNSWNDTQRFLRRAQMPATLFLIAANILTWLLITFLGSRLPVGQLAFNTQAFPMPDVWSVATWPFLSVGNPLFIIFAAYWACTIGGSLERSWGTRTLVLFFFATNILMALSVWVGSTLLHLPAGLSGLWAAITPVTVAWCLINRRETVNLYFMPVPALFLAYLAMLLLWWEVGPPLLGFFALVPCGAAWWYAEKGRYSSYGGYNSTASSPTLAGFRARFSPGGTQNPVGRQTAPRREGLSSANSNPGFNPVRWWKRRQENRKLEAMFRRSGYTDDENKK